MSKEQKTLKSCYILDRLREWFELYGNQNYQRAEEELHLAIDELYEYQQKDRQLADLEAKLAEKDEQLEYFSKRDDEQEKQLEKQASFHRKSIKELRQQLEEKDQRIAELEEQLRNSRVKFFIGFDSDFNLAVKELDLNIVLPNWMHDKEFKFYDTKEEALAKLEELKRGENK